MAVTIRPATAADDRALAALDAAAWPVELQVVPPRGADRPFFDERRRAADVLVAVLPDDGRLVGYAHLARHLPVAANEHVLHLNALAVAPAARGHGAGSGLVAAAVEEARRRGARKLGLRVLSTNAGAIGLYLRAGFEQEGRLAAEIRLPDGSYADDLWFARWLVPPPGS